MSRVLVNRRFWLSDVNFVFCVLVVRASVCLVTRSGLLPHNVLPTAAADFRKSRRLLKAPVSTVKLKIKSAGPQLCPSAKHAALINRACLRDTASVPVAAVGCYRVVGNQKSMSSWDVHCYGLFIHILKLKRVHYKESNVKRKRPNHFNPNLSSVCSGHVSRCY